jgi:DnaJ-class molecular chaperone
MIKDKLVPCPSCSGNGYIRNPPGDPDVKGLSVDQCSLCDSEGEVPKHLADDWPFK